MISFEEIRKSDNYQNGQFTLCDETVFNEYYDKLLTFDKKKNVEVDTEVLFKEGDIYINDQKIGSLDLETNVLYYYLYGPYYEFTGKVVKTSSKKIQVIISLPRIIYQDKVINLEEVLESVILLQNIFYQSYTHLTTYDFGPDDLYALNGLVRSYQEKPLTEQQIKYLDDAERCYVLFPSIYVQRYQLDVFDKDRLIENYQDMKNK